MMHTWVADDIALPVSMWILVYSVQWDDRYDCKQAKSRQRLVTALLTPITAAHNCDQERKKQERVRESWKEEEESV